MEFDAVEVFVGHIAEVSGMSAVSDRRDGEPFGVFISLAPV